MHKRGKNLEPKARPIKVQSFKSGIGENTLKEVLFIVDKVHNVHKQSSDENIFMFATNILISLIINNIDVNYEMWYKSTYIANAC